MVVPLSIGTYCGTTTGGVVLSVGAPPPAGGSVEGGWSCSGTTPGSVVPVGMTLSWTWPGAAAGSPAPSSAAGAGVTGAMARNRHSVPGRYRRTAGRVGAGGAIQSVTGSNTCAGSMYASQMRAGNVPPCTRGTPSSRNSGMRVISVYRFGSRTSTAVVRNGVDPTNHDVVLRSWVPVFPDAGRCVKKSLSSRRPVPDVSTSFIVSTAVSATSGSSTWVPGSSWV
jgi:hypothetical protein